MNFISVLYAGQTLDSAGLSLGCEAPGGDD